MTNDEIVKLIKNSAPAAKKRRKRSEKQALTQQPGVIYAAGTANVLTGGKVTQHITNHVTHITHHHPATRQRVVVTTRGSVVAAGDVHIHHHYGGNALQASKNVHSGLNPERE